MFDLDFGLKQLQAMSSQQVACLVREALIESEVEFSTEDIGIIFDGITSWDHCLFKVSANSSVSDDNVRTGYYTSDIRTGRKTMLRMDNRNITTDFAADKFVLDAA